MKAIWLACHNSIQGRWLLLSLDFKGRNWASEILSNLIQGNWALPAPLLWLCHWAAWLDKLQASLISVEPQIKPLLLAPPCFSNPSPQGKNLRCYVRPVAANKLWKMSPTVGHFLGEEHEKKEARKHGASLFQFIRFLSHSLGPSLARPTGRHAFAKTVGTTFHGLCHELSLPSTAKDQFSCFLFFFYLYLFHSLVWGIEN